MSEPADRGRDVWNDVVPRVDPERCRHCADCAPIAACLAGGFRRDDPSDLPFADPDLCFGCYSCVGACSHKAILMPRGF
jgi:NAD-dependent dihydropyrimidine dehydrogenase PreA subunit